VFAPLVDKDVDGAKGGPWGGLSTRQAGAGIGIVHPEDVGDGVVSAGVVQAGDGVGGAFILAGDVEGSDVEDTGLGLELAGVGASHQGAASRVEEASRAVDGLEEVLGGDDRMVAAVLADLGVEEETVGGVLGDHLRRADHPDATAAVAAFLALELDLFLPEIVGGELDGPDIDGGGVVGGAHRREDGLDVGPGLLLGLVDDQEMMGGLASSGGGRMAGDKGHAGGAQAPAVGLGALGPFAGIPHVVEPLLEAVDAQGQVDADRPVDDGGTDALEEVQEVDQELGDGLVLPGLAGEDEQELEALLLEDRVENSVERCELVVA
jgi:hypothetical protein